MKARVSKELGWKDRRCLSHHYRIWQRRINKAQSVTKPNGEVIQCPPRTSERRRLRRMRNYKRKRGFRLTREKAMA